MDLEVQAGGDLGDATTDAAIRIEAGFDQEGSASLAGRSVIISRRARVVGIAANLIDQASGGIAGSPSLRSSPYEIRSAPPAARPSFKTGDGVALTYEPKGEPPRSAHQSRHRPALVSGMPSSPAVVSTTGRRRMALGER